MPIMIFDWIVYATGSLLVILFLSQAIYIFREYERGVVFTLGRFTKVCGPGFVIMIPVVQQVVRTDLRTFVEDVPTQDVISRDNVSVKVNAVIYFRVMDPPRVIVEVENYMYATSQVAQTTLRAVLGQADLDHLLSERDELNSKLQGILDARTDPWGIKVSMVEVKHVDLPQEVIRAIAKQAEAERERRGKVIHAEGEKQAAEMLVQAAETMSREPAALQLRYLQTLTEIAGEKSSTIVFPIPLDIISNFMDWAKKKDS